MTEWIEGAAVKVRNCRLIDGIGGSDRDAQACVWRAHLHGVDEFGVGFLHHVDSLFASVGTKLSDQPVKGKFSSLTPIFVGSSFINDKPVVSGSEHPICC